MLDVINKHKENEKFLYVCSENQQDNDICGWLKLHKCSFDLAFMYRSISNDITPLFAKKGFEIICFFTPSGVKSLFDNTINGREFYKGGNEEVDYLIKEIKEQANTFIEEDTNIIVSFVKDSPKYKLIPHYDNKQILGIMMIKYSQNPFFLHEIAGKSESNFIPLTQF